MLFLEKKKNKALSHLLSLCISVRIVMMMMMMMLAAAVATVGAAAMSDLTQAKRKGSQRCLTQV